jgi:hypothetical protein
LEVAEHLPADASEKFIKSLCGMGDLIVFSGAIPGQGGHNHVNERWSVSGSSCFQIKATTAMIFFEGKFGMMTT